MNVASTLSKRTETFIRSLGTVTSHVTFEAELIGFDTMPKPGFHRHPVRIQVRLSKTEHEEKMDELAREGGVEKEGEKEEGSFSKGNLCLHKKLSKGTLLQRELHFNLLSSANLFLKV